jgi:hypothetical protein
MPDARRFTEADEGNLFELNSDPEVMRFLNGGKPTPRDEVRTMIIPTLLGYYERFEGFGFWAGGGDCDRSVPGLVPFQATAKGRRHARRLGRGGRDRAWLPPAPVRLGEGLCDRGSPVP